MAITSIDHVRGDAKELGVEALRGRGARKAHVNERFTRVEPETAAVESRTERATSTASAAAPRSTEIRPDPPTHLGRVPPEITSHRALNRKLSRISAKIDHLLKSPDLGADTRADLGRLRDRFPGRLEDRLASLGERRLGAEQVARRVARTIDRLDARVRGFVSETRVDRAVAKANEKVDAALGTRDLGPEHQAALETLRTDFLARTDDLSAGIRFARSVPAGVARADLKAATRLLTQGVREVLFEDRVDKLTTRAHERIGRILDHHLLGESDKEAITTALAAFDERVAAVAAGAQGADRAGIKDAKRALNAALQDLVATAKGELRQARLDRHTGPSSESAAPLDAAPATEAPATTEHAPATTTATVSATATATTASAASLAEMAALLDSVLASFREVFEQFAALDPVSFEIDFSLRATTEGVTFSFASAYQGGLDTEASRTVDRLA